MKNLKLVLLLSFLTITTIYAQKADPKHINFYNDIEKIETDDYIINIVDVVSRVDMVKFKIRISNKTSDFLLFKAEESIFKFDHGSYNPKEKPLKIEPFDTKSKVIEIKGTENFHADKFDFEITGIYKISTEGKSFETPNFQLPPSTKDFKAGPFTCILLDTKQETQETWAKFKCTYNGSNVGFINSAKCVVQISDGKEFATVNLKSKTEILFPGEDNKFGTVFQIPAKVTDMQFTTMNIIWKDAFIESKTLPIASQKVSFQVDATKTSVKN